MAVPKEAITLHPDNVLFETYTDTYIAGIGDVSTGKVLLIGVDVKDWAVGDVIFYDTRFSYRFVAQDKTYSIIQADKILLKYLPEESLQKQL